MTDQFDLHNRIAGPIITSIVKPPIEAGGTYSDVLVLLESVITGVLMAGVKIEGREIILDRVAKGVRGRLAVQRLADAKPGGSA